MQTYILSLCGIILLILVMNSARPFYNFYQYSGLRAIWEKLFPLSPKDAEERPKPSTFVLWAVSIYVALFSIASARYDRAVSSYEMQITAWQTQMATDFRAEVCANLTILQQIKVPKKPDILKPSSTIKSFYTNEKYDDGQATLIHTIEAYKKNLCYAKLTGSDLKNAKLIKADLREADLGGADLREANLRRAYLENADLGGADLREANLRRADLRGAYLENADLRDAHLEKADLRRANLEMAYLGGADLREANLRRAYLENADLGGADLGGADLGGADLENAYLGGADLRLTIVTHTALGETQSLYRATLPPEIEKALKKTHPHLFEKPNWLEEN
ncbi:pentapeptide repeat-containing protein [Maridesulfovibrio sp.]|uniref:pentapeptide repeat-containing protein n=1 Tax=Maridesulfovibrio sp. TaxID=2795000 RepID=UPI0029CA8E45|nr:pentapeptide repeat-containing protein [Maridesulfovibrio sp.]